MSSQPTLQQAYETKGNPTDKEPVEQSKSSANAHSDAPAIDQRIPTKQTHGIEEATPSSMGRGIRGAPPGEEAKGYTNQDVNNELDAEQMGAPGEGKIDSAVHRKPGAGGNEPGLETDLDRKKEEQASARQHVKEQKQHDVDVGGVLGQRGGPANPVDKGNYPNA